jgi:hypothetical protein
MDWNGERHLLQRINALLMVRVVLSDDLLEHGVLLRRRRVRVNDIEQSLVLLGCARPA